MGKRDDDTTIEITDPATGEVLLGKMSGAAFSAAAKRASEQIKNATDFALEPSEPEAGQIPEAVIEELRHARAVAKDYAQGYSDACKAQAEKYKLKPSALKRYIAALNDDKLDDLDAETSDIEKLMS